MKTLKDISKLLGNGSGKHGTDAAWLQCCDDEEKLYIMKHLSEKLEHERDEARRVATQYADAYGGAFDLPWEYVAKTGK